MKNPAIRKNHSAKGKTLNYPADSHKRFCKRCLISNSGKCPNTGRIVTDPNCTL